MVQWVSPQPVLVDSPMLLCHRLQKRQKLAVFAAETYDLRAVRSLTLCSLGSRKGGSVRVVWGPMGLMGALSTCATIFVTLLSSEYRISRHSNVPPDVVNIPSCDFLDKQAYVASAVIQLYRSAGACPCDMHHEGHEFFA
jgi:hypothetical protein